STSVYVAPGSTSVVSGEFKPNPNNSQPIEGLSPQSNYRYFPTIYHRESTGLLKLSAEPKEASIYIDNKLVAPAERLNTGVIGLTSGSHNIRIAMQGYKSYSGKVDITEDETTELKARLERE
ncbi:MAG: PEGA domain-containing protein, partial [Thermodesulfobacteriota bacterium]